MSVDQQTSIIGEPSGDSVTIETAGHVLKPWLQLPGALVDECKVHVDSDGLTATMVDAANVAMCDLRIPAAAFSRYELHGEPFSVGLNLKTLQSHLHTCRGSKRNSDDIELQLDQSHTRLTVEREYSETTVRRTDQFLAIDADAIREEPDLPDLSHDQHASIDVRAFADVLDHCDAVGDHATMQAFEEDLIVSARMKRDDDGESRITDASESVFKAVLDEAVDEPVQSAFSLDYLQDIIDGCHAAQIETVDIELADEYPMLINFERRGEDGETVLYDGLFMIAPRIRRDD